jgi:ribosomal RNA-processing protein 1
MPRKTEDDTTEIEPERILVHKLVDSSKAQRTKAVERLKLWINARTLNPTSFFTKEDLIKIWKGLYYNMWMADKPLLQVILSIFALGFYSFNIGSISFTNFIMDS